eukprot:497853_1
MDDINLLQASNLKLIEFQHELYTAQCELINHPFGCGTNLSQHSLFPFAALAEKYNGYADKYRKELTIFQHLLRKVQLIHNHPTQKQPQQSNGNTVTVAVSMNKKKMNQNNKNIINNNSIRKNAQIQNTDNYYSTIKPSPNNNISGPSRPPSRPSRPPSQPQSQPQPQPPSRPPSRPQSQPQPQPQPPPQSQPQPPSQPTRHPRSHPPIKSTPRSPPITTTNIIFSPSPSKTDNTDNNENNENMKEKGQRKNVKKKGKKKKKTTKK